VTPIGFITELLGLLIDISEPLSVSTESRMIPGTPIDFLLKVLDYLRELILDDEICILLMLEYFLFAGVGFSSLVFSETIVRPSFS
jgi:hypothetical protein